MKKFTFILSDQSINSYLFIVLTSGISLEFFEKNPVMLLNHNPDIILGKWENVRIEGTQLLADAVFDENDAEAMKMYSKVEKGMLNCVSIGFQILEVQYGIVGFEDYPVVIKCSLKEASLTPVPANEGALRLYDKDGVLLSNEQVTTLLSNNQKINNHMKKLQFFIAALTAANMTLPDNATEDDVLKAVQKLSADCEALKTAKDLAETERDTLKTKLTAIEKTVKDAEELKVTELIDGAVKAGKLTSDKKEQFLKLAKADFTTTKDLIDSMPIRQSLASKIEGQANQGDKYAGWGLKRLHKEAPAELMRIKTEEPERYKQLLKENA